MHIFRKILFILLFSTSLHTFAQDAQHVDDTWKYIKNHKELAIEQMIKYKIPASITLAQGIIETNSGKSRLAVKANNHFGIKCHEWKGKKIYHDDDRRNECFRKYKSAEQSYIDHSEFLTNRPRYAGLFELDIDDYKGWAKGLKKAGYATDPKYPAKLIKTIEDYALYKYDQFVLGIITEEELEETSPRLSSKVKEEIEYNIDKQNFDNNIFLHYKPGTCDCINEAMFIEVYGDRGIYLYNGVFVTFAQKNETLKQIAASVNISKRKLLKYNDLPKKAIIAEGDIIYLDYKNSRGKEKYHIVQYDDETLWSISQCRTVTIKRLLKKNAVDDVNKTLPIGMRIKLR